MPFPFFHKHQAHTRRPYHPSLDKIKLGGLLAVGAIGGMALSPLISAAKASATPTPLPSPTPTPLPNPNPVIGGAVINPQIATSLNTVTSLNDTIDVAGGGFTSNGSVTLYQIEKGETIAQFSTTASIIAPSGNTGGWNINNIAPVAIGGQLVPITFYAVDNVTGIETPSYTIAVQPSESASGSLAETQTTLPAIQSTTSTTTPPAPPVYIATPTTQPFMSAPSTWWTVQPDPQHSSWTDLIFNASGLVPGLPYNITWKYPGGGGGGGTIIADLSGSIHVPAIIELPSPGNLPLTAILSTYVVLQGSPATYLYAWTDPNTKVIYYFNLGSNVTSTVSMQPTTISTYTLTPLS